MENEQIVVYNNDGQIRVFENIESYLKYGKNGGRYSPRDDELYHLEYGKDIFELEPFGEKNEILIVIEEALGDEFCKKMS